MNEQLDASVEDEHAVSELRHRIRERIADPFMTEHDRWVLSQFERFLGGIAPEPDPRIRSAAPVTHLHPRAVRHRV